MSREIINNFLSMNDFISLKQSILNESFPWSLADKTYANSTESRFNCQFVHIFYQSPTYTSQYIDILNPLLKKIKHSLFIRAKVNITTASETIQTYGYHIDIPESLAKISKTAIFYLNTNNGFTIFENDDQKVDSLENRLLVFNSTEMHSGTNCTDQKYRAVINLNYIP